MIITGKVGGCSRYILKDHIKHSMKISSMIAISDAPLISTIDPVSVLGNSEFILQFARAIHFTIMAEL